jgi:hypothetical protein
MEIPYVRGEKKEFTFLLLDSIPVIDKMRPVGYTVRG